MKKYLLIVTVVLGLSLAACSGKKGEKATDETVPQEQVTPAVEGTDNAIIGVEEVEPQAEPAEAVGE